MAKLTANMSVQQSNDQRKVVFKHTLANPYTIKCILEPICRYRREMSTYHRAVRFEKRQAKSAKTGSMSRVKRSEKPRPEPSLPAKPPTYGQVILGINQVTRYLESAAAASDSRDNGSLMQQDVAVVVAFSADMDPPHLAGHLPALCHVVAAKQLLLHEAASQQPDKDRHCLRLISMPKDTEHRFASMLRQKRVGALAITLGREVDTLVERIQSILPPPLIAWLDTSKSPELHPSTIRAVKTSAPLKKPKGRADKQGSSLGGDAKCSAPVSASAQDRGGSDSNAAKKHKISK
ncbi:RNase P and RNase MRP subunit [Spiromyces aspiralis]|uniref:RNase P and RNase MRP subunit n=1 Tax=Spiromyces aspiralis TaxID=68401 RepID=A0ACC1HDW8_9FUNG|nr:RNase P and RNase MRP subunit [Spiromyces aspiralis]